MVRTVSARGRRESSRVIDSALIDRYASERHKLSRTGGEVELNNTHDHRERMQCLSVRDELKTRYSHVSICHALQLQHENEKNWDSEGLVARSTRAEPTFTDTPKDSPWTASGRIDLWARADAMFLFTSERTTTAEAIFSAMVVVVDNECSGAGGGRTTDSLGRT